MSKVRAEVKKLSEYTLEELDQLIEDQGSQAAAARFIGAKSSTFRDARKRLQKDAEYGELMSEEDKEADNLAKQGLEKVESDATPMGTELIPVSKLPARKRPPKSLDRITRFPAIVKLDEAEALAVYQEGVLQEEFGLVLRGYAAAGYKATVGTLEDFAKIVDQPYSSVKEQARIYERLTGLEEDDQSSLLQGVKDGVLSYTHFLRANPIKDDAAYVGILEQAASENRSRGWVGEMAQEWRRMNLLPAHDKDAPAVSEQEGWSQDEDNSYSTKSRQDLLEEIEGLQHELDYLRSNPEPQVIEAVAPIVENERYDAFVTDEGDRYQFLDSREVKGLEMDEPWFALVDTITGDLILNLASIRNEPAFAEFLINANRGAVTDPDA